MKYIVTLKKVVEKKVVIDAENLEEADSKLLDGDVVFSIERTVSDDVYDGWEYKSEEIEGVDQNCLPVDDEDEVICNLDDFAKWFGCDSVDHLERALYKYTDCGMCYSADENSITLVGYVEGADCEHPSETLIYPFTGSHVKKVMAYLEEEADEMWHEWNDPNEGEQWSGQSMGGV